ncbi:GNAT family N-acetyltransferase [Pelagibius litoralis]|uniref:GNAT family N-acetyltransferase n=1 Tax=Pelagibius litoralis TaxID=374515 RepID=A0A967C8H8_9PROT|nr:GNAT family N-acetyltransferase [Pelagibius litoralis]NIA68697.1 GNAT family N-acetyltransferase [Pelagibius litoralis]
MNKANTIRPARPDDKAALMALAEATGLFEAPELEEFEAMLSASFAGDLGDDHLWIVAEDDSDVGGGLRAAAYYAPEMMADAVWNLYFIGVHPDQQGQGRGAALLRHVEDDLRAKGQRLLLVETSGSDSLELTRRFYRKNGYDEEARLRDFYRAGEDKVIFRKAL